MSSLLMLWAGYLVARKVTDDLDAFKPGPPRLSDLLVFVLTFLMMLVTDVALGTLFQPETLRLPAPVIFL